MIPRAHQKVETRGNVMKYMARIYNKPQEMESMAYYLT